MHRVENVVNYKYCISLWCRTIGHSDLAILKPHYKRFLYYKSVLSRTFHREKWGGLVLHTVEQYRKRKNVQAVFSVQK